MPPRSVGSSPATDPTADRGPSAAARPPAWTSPPVEESGPETAGRSSPRSSPMADARSHRVGTRPGRRRPRRDGGEDLDDLLRSLRSARVRGSPARDGYRRGGRVPDGRVAAGPRCLPPDRAGVLGLNGIGSRFASVEEPASGVDVILPGDEFGDHLAGSLGRGGCPGHETRPASAMPEPNPSGLPGRPGFWGLRVHQTRRRHGKGPTPRSIKSREHSCYQLFGDDKRSSAGT